MQLRLTSVTEWRIVGAGLGGGPPFSLSRKQLHGNAPDNFHSANGGRRGKSTKSEHNAEVMTTGISDVSSKYEEIGCVSSAQSAGTLGGRAAVSGAIASIANCGRRTDSISDLPISFSANNGSTNSDRIHGALQQYGSASSTLPASLNASSDSSASLPGEGAERGRSLLRGSLSADSSPVYPVEERVVGMTASVHDSWRGTAKDSNIPDCFSSRVVLDGKITDGGEEILLVLIRHGESEANQCNRAQVSYGGIDAPLTPLGTAQAEAISSSGLVSRWDVQRVVVSPLRRALGTAARVFRGPRTERIVALPALTEFGGHDDANAAVSQQMLHAFVAEDLDRPGFPVVDLDQVQDGWWSARYCDDVSRVYELFAYLQSAPERRFAAVTHYCTIAEILRALGCPAYVHPHNCSPIEIRLRRVPLAVQQARISCRIYVEPRNLSTPLMKELELLDMIVQSFIARNGAPPTEPSFLQIMVLDGVQISLEQRSKLHATLRAFCQLLHSERRGAFHIGPISAPHLHADVRTSLVCRVECRTLKLLATLVESCLDGAIQSGSGGPVLDLRWFDYPGPMQRGTLQWLNASAECPTLATVIAPHDDVLRNADVWQEAIRAVRWRVRVSFNGNDETFDI